MLRVGSGVRVPGQVAGHYTNIDPNCLIIHKSGYNRLVDTTLKESVFVPMRYESFSSTIAGMATFIISGLLRAHVAFVAFDDISCLFPTFMFFLLHGIACSFEANTKIELPEHARWFLIYTFLLITAPFMIGPFIKEGSPFLHCWKIVLMCKL